MEESCEQPEQVDEQLLEASNTEMESEKIHAEQQEEEKEEEKDRSHESESEPEDVNEERPAMEICYSEQLVAAEQTAAVCSSAVAEPVDFVPEGAILPEVEKVVEVEKVDEAEDEMVNNEERLVESPVPAVMDPEPGQLASCDGSEMEAATLGSLQPSKEVMEEIVDSTAAAAASVGSSLEEVGEPELVDEVAAVTSEPTLAGAAEHDPLAAEQQADDDDDSSSAKPLIAAAAGSVAAVAAVAAVASTAAAGHSKEKKKPAAKAPAAKPTTD